MSETSRRQTRSQTARSRAQTPESSASRDEPQAPASVRSRASTRRSARTKPLLKTETSATYGSRGQSTFAQQLAAHEAMSRAVNIIQTEVAGAEQAGPSRRLSTVNEGGTEGDSGGESRSAVNSGNVSGKEKDPPALELTVPPKSFHQELGDESNRILPPRVDPSRSHGPNTEEIVDESNRVLPLQVDPPRSHGPNTEEDSLMARLRASLYKYSPILAFLLVVVITSMLVANWMAWRRFEQRLVPGEYNRSFVHEELDSQNRLIQERFDKQDLQIDQHSENHYTRIEDRANTRDREMRWLVDEKERERQAHVEEEEQAFWDRIDERVRQEREQTDNQITGLRERSDSQNHEMRERLKEDARHFKERNEEVLQERDQRINERLDEQQRLLRQLRSDFNSGDLKSPGSESWRINWFSRGLASISTRFSSPTMAYPLTFKEKLASVRIGLGQLPKWETERSAFEDPMSIFNAWDSFGQKWCAPSQRGKLQAVVRLAYNMAPTGLVVEHMKKSQMPDVEIGTAPKEVELWIRLPDAGERERVIDRIEGLYPSITTKKASQRGKTIDPQIALDKTWVPVGRWDFDVHRDQSSQTFVVPFNLEEMGIKTQAVALRVNSNWGSMDSTCLYRVRMYGASMEPPTEFPDLELIPDDGVSPKRDSGFKAWTRWASRRSRD